MIAVLDTNVLASGTVTAITTPGQILDYWHLGKFNLAISEHIIYELKQIIYELKQTFTKPYFQKHVSSVRVANFIDLLQNEALIIPITVKVQGVATHPEDDLVLAAALSAKADYLVTGDGPLLRKVGSTYQGVKLVTPNEFLEILQKQS